MNKKELMKMFLIGFLGAADFKGIDMAFTHRYVVEHGDNLTVDVSECMGGY